MTSYARQAIILGLTVTLLVVGIELLGVFDALERETIDLRFAQARWREEPLSDQIRFVDIDDGALNSVGRWPWPRSRLADAIDELRRAAVRTIAIDLILEDAQKPEYRPGAADPIDHDANLAEALASVQCVLAVRVADRTRFGDAWQTGPGAAELHRLLDVLSRDIQLEPSEAAESAELTGERRARFLDRPLEFKKLAAYEALERLSEQPEAEITFTQFEGAVAPRVDEHTGDYPELLLLRNAWFQHEAWRLVAASLLTEEHPAGSYQDGAPFPPFAEQANLVGFVNRQEDADGEVRKIRLLRPARGGNALQFGLAAAILHLRLPPSDIRIDDDRAVIGAVELPLIQRQLWLAWPTTENDWSGVLRFTETQRPTAGRISIGALTSLAEQRRKLVRLRKESLQVSREIARDLGLIEEDAPSDVMLSASTMVTVREEVIWRLQDAQEIVAQGQGALTEEEKDLIGPYRNLDRLEEEITKGENTIADDEGRLHAEVRDKLVFIGMTATAATTDSVPTPLGSETPGVVVHAVVADMALTGRRVRPVPSWTGWGLAALFGLLCTSLAARLTPAFSTLLVLVMLAGYVGVAGWWLFGFVGSIFPMVGPISAGAGSWIACTALKATLFQRDRRRIARRFKSRVSPQLVDYLIDNPNALSMIGEQREVTVMFLDLAGFTAMTESLDGAIVVAALNRCMSELTSHITHHEGYVAKFLGDGLMAFWSAFRPDPYQAVRACTSALECRDGLARLNRSEGFAHLPSLSARFGIATGQVIVGDCGAPPQLNDYTVIGNEVNLASRLESANKQFGTSILITDRTRDQLGRAELRTRPIGRIIVVGQTVPVSVYELLPGDADSTMIELTEQAVGAFARREYPASAAAWRRLTDTFGPSKLAEFYLEAIADSALVVDGALRLHEK